MLHAKGLKAVFLR